MLAEKEALEAQLRQSQKLESIGTLASGVAHDFNNLLTVIMGHAQMGLMNTDEDDPLHRNLKQILTASTSAANLTRQLLIFSRKEVMELKPVDINQTIQNLLKMLGRLIGENIAIETTLEPAIWTIEADEGNLEQVLTNLAVNARDAMPDGGKLSIQTENVEITESDKKHILHAEVGNYVRIGVSDNGKGIPGDIRDKIFDPFFTTKASGRGTGLGLSVVYGIVKKHGGWINFYSEVDKGTRFNIYLPAAGKVTTSDQTDEREIIESLYGDGERILLIEDEQSVLEFTLNALRKYDYQVFPVSNGREALRVFTAEKGRFDLIFSDVILPDTNGYELVQKLSSGKPDIPVILSSGYTDERIREQIGKDTSINFIQKPYSISRMLEAVKIALQKSQKNR
ncbi:MAG: ATP-binding protein [Fidelibacterota bacterium]